MGNKALVIVENNVLKICLGDKVQNISLNNVKILKIYNMSVFTFEYNNGHEIDHYAYNFSPCCLADPMHVHRIKQECRNRNIPTVHYSR